jgi:hypothetical protein
VADVLEKFIGLGKMAGRIVRGAKSGNKNNPDAGVLHVVTEKFSDSKEPQDILLQPEAAPATEITVTGVTFTAGSEVVLSSEASAFSGVAPGDMIRPGTFSGPFFRISKLEICARVIISEPCTLSSGDSSWTGVAQVHKVEFGRTSVFSYEHSEASPAFSYETKTDRWELAAGASSKRLGPHLLKSSESSNIRDGVSVVPIASSDPTAQDVDIIGVLKKTLPQVPVDSLFVTLSPVPYPSPLSGAAGGARFQLEAKYPGQPTYRLQKADEDYVLSYTNNPLYDGYRPLPAEATQANIHALKEFSITQSLPEDFTGSLAINDVTYIWGESLVIDVGGQRLAHNTDYMVDASSGTVTFLEDTGEDSLVASVLTELPGTYSGLVLKTAPVLFAEAKLSDTRIRQIYGEYVDAKRAAKESTAGVTFDTLAKQLRQQAEKLEASHPGRSVDYNVVMKNGKPTLKPVLR